jgi:lysyl-tRNA synthetase class 2
MNPQTDPAWYEEELPEQMRVRRTKRADLIERGVEPYPISVPRTHSLRQVRELYDTPDLDSDGHTGVELSVTGRVIFRRDTGKLCFLRLREGDGTELQAMVSLAGVGEESLADLKNLVDIGDLLSVTGEVVRSRRGELSVRVRSWQFAAKALRPLPVEHRPLSDEAKIRMRYVDMIQHERPRQMVRAKATVLKSFRSTLDRLGYMEVETPVLQLTNGGAAARPFRTHLDAFDQEMLLRIALELDLKRAVAGGIEQVYEIGKTFRNEGIDSTHSAEFMMMEAYQAYGDYNTMMDLARELILDAAKSLDRMVVPARDGSEIDLSQPWRRASLLELVSEAVGERLALDTDVGRLRQLAAEDDVELHESWGTAEIIHELYEKLVERTLIQPTFVCDYPAAVRPLAKPHRTEPDLVEAFDLVINGVEIGPAYTELNDPVIQRERLVEQSLLVAAGDPEAMDLDEEFLRAMEFGMPPMGGIGLGIDRLVALLMGAGSIRESILFPLLRPE